MIAAEFMNEPDIASVGGAPAGYDVAAFARDIAASMLSFGWWLQPS
jgi:hypothetical protein